MKQYEMVFCDKGTKYEKEVIRVFIPFEKDGTPIENPDSSNCRRVIVGTRKEFNAGLSRYKTDAEKLRIIEKRVLKKRQEIIIGIERGNVASRKNRKKKQALMQDLFNAFILDYQSKNSMVTNQPPSASSVKTMKDHWKKYILIYGNHNCGKFPDDFEERWIKTPGWNWQSDPKSVMGHPSISSYPGVIRMQGFQNQDRSCFPENPSKISRSKHLQKNKRI
tara:strand:+ start:103 stop:765 length:663 start_codon:yes stop_codon:yes gene_type:complete